MNNLSFYTVTAYRWGHPENHSYIVGVFDESVVAIEAAKHEQADRGGNKYFCEVRKHTLNERNKGVHVWGKVSCWTDDSSCEYCGHPIEKGNTSE